MSFNSATDFSIKGTPQYIATSLSKVYVVCTVPRGKSSGITVATLDSVTGTLIDHHQLDASLISERDLQVVGSHSYVPLAIWSEKGKVRANILGSKQVANLPLEVSSSETRSNVSMTLHLLQFLPHSPVYR